MAASLVFLLHLWHLFSLNFTCPSADEHKRVLSDVVTSTINDVTTSAVNDSTDELTSKALQTFNDVFTKKNYKWRYGQLSEC